MTRGGTAILVATTGKDAVELFDKVDQFLMRDYRATQTSVGQYVLESHLNIHAFDVILDELLVICQDYGPDTYFSAISIKSNGLNFRCKNMGL